MAFEDIIKRIQKDAEQKAQSIITAAEEQAKQIISDAENNAAKVKQELQARSKQRADEEELRIVTLARLDQRKALLKAKQDQVEQVFQQAFETLSNLKDSDYKRFIKALMLKSIETGEEVIFPPANGRWQITERIVKEINKEKRAKISLAKEKRNIAGGFILRRGKQEINYSLEAIVNNIREQLESQVVKILFQEK